MTTIALTGATGGLGRATARALLARSDVERVVLLVRDPSVGATLAGELNPAGSRTVVLACDLASLAAVDRVAGELAARGDVGVVIANAGTQVSDAVRTSADGLELTFAVNHLAHWLLIDRLQAHLAAPARVLVVSSGTHRTEFRHKGPYPNPQWRPVVDLARPGALPSGQVAYATSKLANAMHVTALAAAGVDAIAFDPGLMPGTGLARDYGPLQRAVWNRLLPRLARVIPFMSTPERSGALLAALAAAHTPVHPPGTYVEVDHVLPAAPLARDPVAAATLMHESTQLVTRVLARAATQAQ